MQDKIPDGIKVINLTKENDGLRSTIADLQRKNRKDKTKLLVLCAVLLIAALISGVFYFVANEGYNHAREEISSLSYELDVLKRKYSGTDELKAENASLERQIEEQKTEIASLEADLAAYSSSSSGSSSSTTSSTSDTQSVTVYITNTGSKYHKNGCQYLRESKNAVTLAQAKSWGYTACSRCY